jgi:hypothetical protein
MASPTRYPRVMPKPRERDAPSVEPCKLCGVVTELQDSHIMPRWTYRRVVRSTPNDPNHVTIRRGEATLGEPQFSERLLCIPCEQRIGKWDRHVAEISLQPNGKFPIRDGAQVIPELSDGDLTTVDVSAYDPARLGRFGASVIYRAAVSTLFSDVRLGERYQPVIADYLLRDDAPFPACASLYLELFRTRELPVDKVVAAPSSERKNGHYLHSFTAFGMAFKLSIGGGLPELYSEICVARTGRAVRSDGEHAVRNIAAAFAGIRARGRLARMGKSK